MRRSRLAMVPLALGLPVAGLVHAQQPLVTRPVVGHVAAGYAAPRSDAEDVFHGGWQVSGGATFHFSPAVPVGLRLDLGASRFNADKQLIDTADFPSVWRVEDGSLSIAALTVGALFEFGGSGHVGGWFGAGVGAFHRRTDIALESIPPACDDVVDPGSCILTPSERLDQEDRLTRVGFDVNAAVRFPLASGSEVFLEARYQRMESEPATELVPISVGFRW